MKKYVNFVTEINYIKNANYIENIKILLELLPDYFYEIPASSTGKYHPKYALGDGGLVRHTKVAVRIAHELLNNNTIGIAFNEREKDLIIMALLLHDGLKEGLIKEKYTRFDHPIIMGEFIKSNRDKLTLNDQDVDFLVDVISSHMGEWNTNPYSKVVLPLPNNKYKKFVHMCDFLASKKFLNVEFDGNNIID